MTERDPPSHEQLALWFNSLGAKDQEMIIFLYEWGRPIRIGDIKAYLNYPHSTLNSVAERLQEQDIIEWEAYKTVRLKQVGKDMAAHQLDHHNVIHMYLKEHLELDDEEAHTESLKVAGIFSCDTVEKMRMKLSQPDVSECCIIVKEEK